MKTFKDRLMEMPLDELDKLRDREQAKIKLAQRDLDTINDVIIGRRKNPLEIIVSVSKSLEEIFLNEREFPMKGFKK
jgi:hypothetical protein